MAIYSYDNMRVDTESGADVSKLADLHRNRARLECPCRTPRPEMYIASCGAGFLVKRMPNTGQRHAPECDSYEPPPELSGVAPYIGKAIQELPEDGNIVLRVGFPLSKGPAVTWSPNISTDPKETVRDDPRKLGLRAFLHYLWDEAGFTKWRPGMAGKRKWSVIRYYLLQAARNKLIRNAPLGAMLYVPEPYSQDQDSEIKERRMALLAPMLGKGKKTYRIAIGEVKQILPTSRGHRVVLRHAPGFSFLLSNELHGRMLRNFATELDMHEATPELHLVIAATFSMSSGWLPFIEELTLMAVTPNWIPVVSPFEERLVEELTAQQRCFTKCLRYGHPAGEPLATVILRDTTPHEVALYILPPDAADDERRPLLDLAADSALPAWFWDPLSGETMTLPPRQGQN